MRCRIINLFVFVLLSCSVSAQTEVDVINIFIERYIEVSEDEVDIQQFADELLHYYNNPIDLNKTSILDLYQSPFFTSSQVKEIAEHRKKFGDFISIYELQVLESFTPEITRDLSPFVSINIRFNNAIKWNEVLSKGSHQIMTLAEMQGPKKKGFKIADTASSDFTGNYYEGSQLYSNLRYRFDYKNNLSFGFSAEKDAGESFLTDNQKFGFDYYTFYVALRNVGKVKNLHLGDYQANFGQGLTLATGLAFGKSSLITNAKRNSREFSAYRSLRENAMLRGAAVSFDLGKIQTGVFASYKKVDGNGVIENDSVDSEFIAFTSIQEDGGLHRTANEIADKDALTDLQAGGYAEFLFNRGKLGTIHHARQFEKPLQPTLRPDNKFDFAGDAYSKHGLYWDLALGNFNVFGEATYASNASFAGVFGTLVSAGRNLDISLVHRRYDNDFISLQSNGFGEASTTSNEEGTFFGFEFRPLASFKVLGFYDLYKSNWLGFSTDAPSFGNDFWIETVYKPRKSWEVYYRFRTETKQRNTDGDNIKALAQYTIQRHRIHSKLAVTKWLNLRTRIEWNSATQEGVKTLGSMIYQDIIYKPFGSKFHISYRIAKSNIEDFDNRIYSFEQVALYDYPLHNHSYSGLRTYLMLRYMPTRRLNAWLRYSLTNYTQTLNAINPMPTQGSGLEETEGLNRHLFTLQVRYKIQ